MKNDKGGNKKYPTIVLVEKKQHRMIKKETKKSNSHVNKKEATYNNQK